MARLDSAWREPGLVMDKVVLLAPRNPSSYHFPTQLLAFRRDAEGLRKLLSALSRTDLDLGDQAKNALENYSGKKDDTMKRPGFGDAEVCGIEPPGSCRARGDRHLLWPSRM